jgi:uncharacterized protein YfaS (alpha-2-macroglobulin family)
MVAGCDDSQTKTVANPPAQSDGLSKATESQTDPDRHQLNIPVDPELLKTAQGELKVLNFLPQGQTQRLTQIAVMFNQPMVSLGEYDLVNQDLLSINPPLEGRLRWLNQYTLAFIPEKNYSGSLELTATLKSGLKSLTGNVLATGMTASISLPPVEVSYGSIDIYEPLKPVHYINFSQKVDLNSLEGRLFFTSQAGDEQQFKVPAVFTPSNYQYNPFMLSGDVAPTQDLPLDTDYRIIVEPGVISEAGPLPTDKTIEVVSSRTIGLQKITLQKNQSDSGPISPSSYPTILFSNPVVLSKVIDFIEIEPSLEYFNDLKKRYSAKAKASQKSDSAKNQAASGTQNEGTVDDQDMQEQSDDWFWNNAHSSYLTIYSNLLPETDYVITFKAGMPDVTGQELPKDCIINFQTTTFTPQARIDTESGLLETSTEPIIEIKATALDEVIVEGFALDPAEAVKFYIAKDQYWENNNDVRNKTFDFLYQTGDFKSLVLHPKDGARFGPVTNLVNLETLFGQQSTGKLLVVGLKPLDDDDIPSYNSFLRSDLGLTVKVGRESSLAWVTDLPTGTGLEGAEINVLTATGVPLFQGRTGPEGLLVFPGGLELNEIIESKNLDPQTAFGLTNGYLYSDDLSLFVTAQSGQQMSIWNLGWQSNFYRYLFDLNGGYGIPLGADPDKGFLLTSQPIYRPGSLVHLKIIARQIQGEQYNDLPSGPVKVFIIDPFYNVTYETVAQASSFGTVSLNYQLPPDVKLGTYTVYMSKNPEQTIPEGNSWHYDSQEIINYGHFLVENFRSPPFAMTIDPITSPLFSGDKVSFKGQASYHFGLPVTGSSADYSVTASDIYDFSIPTVSGFSLVSNMTVMTGEDDEDEDYENAYEDISSGSAPLTEAGGFSFDFTVEPPKKPRPRSLYFQVTAKDVDGRPVSEHSTTLVHPAFLYPALKNRNSLGQAGSPQTFELAAVTPDGLFKETEISIKLYRRSWNSARRRGFNASYMYDSKPLDEIIEEIKVKTGAKLAEFSLTPPKPGYYWVSANLTDEKGRTNESTVSFYVSGPGEVGWGYSNDQLTLIPDKTEYAPGDTAKILLQSPFNQGQALVTVERSFIKEVQVVDLTDYSPVFEIPITEEDGPNLFVSVVLVRGRIADKPDPFGIDMGKPTVRTGYLSLSVPVTTDNLKVEVTPASAQYGPGQEVTVDFAVTDSDGRPFADAEVALAVIDAALIQVAGDTNYFPDQVFSALRELNVITASNMPSLIGRRNWENKGGGGRPGGGGGFLFDSANNEGLRKNFLDLSFFDPAIALSSDGRGQVTFSLPDNLTTFKIYAVATGHGRKSGTGQNQFMVSKDLLLRSSLPAYSTVGDQFKAGIIVTNRSDRDGQANITFKAKNLKILETDQDQLATHQIAVPAGQSREVFFPVQAIAQGEANVDFAVTMGELTDQVYYKLNVLPVNRLTTQAAFLQLGPTKESSKIGGLDGVDLDRGGLTVEMAPSLAGVLTSPFEWLEAYPYECVEQRTSKAFGALLRLRLKDRFGDDAKKIDQYRQTVENHIVYLHDIANEGGFSLWPGESGWSENSPALTAYVLEFLLLADEYDFNVSIDFINEIISFLADYMAKPEDSRPNWYDPITNRTVRQYVLSVLTKTNFYAESYIEDSFLLVNSDDPRRSEALGLVDLLYLTRAVDALPASKKRTDMLLTLIPKIYNELDLTSGTAQVATLAPFNRALWFDSDKLTALTALTVSDVAPFGEVMPSLLRALVERTARGHFSTTQSNILALWAIVTYLEKVELEPPNLKIEAALNDQNLVSTSFNSFTAPPVITNVPMAQLSQTSELTVESTGTGQVWLGIKLAKAALAPVMTGEYSSSLIVSREYSRVQPQASQPGLSSFKRGDVVKVTVTVMTPADRYDLVLEDRVPAGFEPINFRLRSEDHTLVAALNTSDAQDSSRGYWYSHQQIWPDRVAVFADHIPAGVYTFSYLARAATPGTYLLPGPTVEEMYMPETFGRGSGHEIIITE